MKNKCITVILLLTFLLGARTGRAQLKGFSIGPYFEAAWPHGDLADAHSNGIGAGLGADVKLGGHISAMGSYGFLHFGRKTGVEGSSAVNALPLRLGLKYKLPFLYFKLESGTATLTRDQGSAVILSPGVGLRLLGLDVQGSYETWLREEGWSFASLKIAYHF